MNKPVGELIYTSYELEKWLWKHYGIEFPFCDYIRDHINESNVLAIPIDYRDYYGEEGWTCLALLISDFGPLLVEAV